MGLAPTYNGHLSSVFPYTQSFAIPHPTSITNHLCSVIRYALLIRQDSACLVEYLPLVDQLAGAGFLEN